MSACDSAESRNEIERTSAVAAECAMLHAIADNLTDGLVVSDGGGMTLYTNSRACDLLGIPTGIEFIGRPTAAIIESASSNFRDPDDWRANYLDSLVRIDERPLYEVTILRPVRRVVEFQLFPFHPTGSAMTVGDGIGMIIRDVTRERWLVDELRGSIADLDAFSLSVSHDLRAPLRAIDGFSRILLESNGADFDARVVHDIEIIRLGVRRMERLIDDLLTLSRFGRLPLVRGPVDADALVRSIVEELHSSYQGRQIAFTFGDLPVCHSEPGLLRQVYVNLISNAIKYTAARASAHIEIGSAIVDGNRAFYVRDDGVGFDMSHASKLFNVFQRLHPEGDYEGTGVGLAIVKRIIERHEGRVWAQASLGCGATFWFTLDGSRRD